MPKTVIDWQFMNFASAEALRTEAHKWEHVAVSAEDDGDMGHAEAARRKAADLRQAAREKEAESAFGGQT